MDRLSKIRDLVEQALDDLSRPTTLGHDDYRIVTALHEISLQLEALRTERARLMNSVRVAMGLREEAPGQTVDARESLRERDGMEPSG